MKQKTEQETQPKMKPKTEPEMKSKAEPKTKTKQKIKMGIDVLMTVLLLGLMACQVTGQLFHE